MLDEAHKQHNDVVGHIPQGIKVADAIRLGQKTILPVSLARKTFRQNNGARTGQEMRARIERYRRSAPNPTEATPSAAYFCRAHFSFNGRSGSQCRSGAEASDREKVVQ